MCDYLALESLVNQVDVALVCDGGPPPAATNSTLNDYSARMRDILLTQSRDLRLRWLLTEFAYSRKHGAYWGIGSRIDEFGASDALVSDCAETLQIEQSHTRLDSIPLEWQTSLVNWGYALTDAGVRTSAGFPVESAQGWPFEDDRLSALPRGSSNPSSLPAANKSDDSEWSPLPGSSPMDLQPVAIRKTLAATRAVWPMQDQVVDASSLGIVVINLNRDVLFANAAATAMMGIPHYEGVNLNSVFVDPKSQEILAQQIELRRNGWVGSYQLTATHPGAQKTIDLEVTALPIREGATEVVGSLAIFRSLQQQQLTREIHGLTRDISSANDLLKKVAERLLTAQPFDMMVVTRYSEDLKHANAFFIFGHAGNSSVQTRWIPLNQAQADWTRNARSFAFNPAELLDDKTFESVRDEPFVREIRAAGYRSAVRRPVLRVKKIKGSLTLMSKGLNTLNSQSVQLLKELPIEAAVLRALELMEDQRGLQLLGLVRELNRCVTVFSACRTLATRLVMLYKWAHVSVFRVDRNHHRLTLVAQHSDENKGNIRLPEGYSQPIEVGLLGFVVENKEMVGSGNVKDDKRYVAGEISGQASSELCCPVFFDSDAEHSVRFIINVEDERQDAFSSDESNALADLAKEIGGVLQRIGQIHFLTQCFEKSGSPIFVTDNELSIKKANREAALLLGRKSAREVTGLLSSFVADAGGAERLKADYSGDLGTFELRRYEDERKSQQSADGSASSSSAHTVPVFILKEKFPEGLDGFIFVVRDLSAMRRTVELELFQEAAYELAVETSTPLNMAIADMQLLADETQSVSEDDLPKLHWNILRRLSRVKQSYTRLALFNSAAQKRLEFNSTPLDVSAEVDAIISSFSPIDQANVDFHDVPEDTDENGGAGTRSRKVIRGDHFQFGIVLETLLSLLVRFSPEREHVVITISRSGTLIVICLVGSLPNVHGIDSGTLKAARLRADLFIAMPLLQTFATNMSGTITTESIAGGRSAFTVRFPSIGAQ